VKKDIDVIEQLERELNLKQLQIKSLLTITQAINENISADSLFNMYKSFLSWEMGVEKMLLYIRSDNKWECVSRIHEENNIGQGTLEILFSQYNRLHTIKSGDPEELQAFDIVIPVYHKKQPLAYALIGGSKKRWTSTTKFSSSLRSPISLLWPLKINGYSNVNWSRSASTGISSLRERCNKC
jgi:sigma-B regulation protein RsbU (phosphoserine phosphatase)